MRYLAVALVLAISPSAFADLVSNGSFETGPSVGGLGYATLTATDSTSVSNWTVTSGDLDYIGGSSAFWPAADGTASLDMNGTGAGQIQQTLSTTSGQAYQLSFMMAVNPDVGAGSSRTLQYDVGTGGADLSGTITATASSTASRTNMEWATYTFAFTATGSSTLLSFTGDSGGGVFGPALDQVSVLETPEPGAFLLFCAGLGALALWRRSQSRKSRTAKA